MLFILPEGYQPQQVIHLLESLQYMDSKSTSIPSYLIR